jgi:hypothetical protein
MLKQILWTQKYQAGFDILPQLSDMSNVQKKQLLGLLIIIILAMVFVAVSLPSLQMLDGETSAQELSLESPANLTGELEGFTSFSRLSRGILVFLIILLCIHIVISLFDEEGRKRLMADVFLIGFVLLIISLLPNNRWLPEPVENETPPVEIIDQTDLSDNGDAPPVFEANAQPWMLTLTIVAIAAGLTAVTFFVLKYLPKKTSDKHKPLQDFADSAQAALEEIETTSQAFSDVVVRCYAEMSQTLQAEKGISRSQAMTTDEFKEQLVLRGFPARPVERLTKLFEQIRYGRQSLRENEKQIAIESLREIVEFCRIQA